MNYPGTDLKYVPPYLPPPSAPPTLGRVSSPDDVITLDDEARTPNTVKERMGMRRLSESSSSDSLEESLESGERTAKMSRMRSHSLTDAEMDKHESGKQPSAPSTILSGDKPLGIPAPPHSATLAGPRHPYSPGFPPTFRQSFFSHSLPASPCYLSPLATPSPALYTAPGPRFTYNPAEIRAHQEAQARLEHSRVTQLRGEGISRFAVPSLPHSPGTIWRTLNENESRIRSLELRPQEKSPEKPLLIPERPLQSELYLRRMNERRQAEQQKQQQEQQEQKISPISLPPPQPVIDLQPPQNSITKCEQEASQPSPAGSSKPDMIALSRQTEQSPPDNWTNKQHPEIRTPDIIVKLSEPSTPVLLQKVAEDNESSSHKELSRQRSQSDNALDKDANPSSDLGSSVGSSGESILSTDQSESDKLIPIKLRFKRKWNRDNIRPPSYTESDTKSPKLTLSPGLSSSQSLPCTPTQKPGPVPTVFQFPPPMEERDNSMRKFRDYFFDTDRQRQQQQRSHWSEQTFKYESPSAEADRLLMRPPPAPHTISRPPDDIMIKKEPGDLPGT